MTKAVFTTRVEPSYDDLPERRYHFPRTYLRQAEAATGDWILYYEPRRTSSAPNSVGGRRAYFATARVRSVERDERHPDHFYAYVDSYLDFVRPVPFREGDQYYESAVRRDDGATNKGAFGRAVRNIPDNEYESILATGFASVLGGDEPEVRTNTGGLDEPGVPFQRPIIERMNRRLFRDAAFSGSIKSAYADTCAFTGIKIINGGGRSEVQAAHIRPVASGGPDSLRNGLALCATAHWMFDRGLISIEDNRSLLFAKGKVPESVMRMMNPDKSLLAPSAEGLSPHPQFLRWHRENVFKG